MCHYIILKVGNLFMRRLLVFFTSKHFKSHTPLHYAGFFSSLGRSLTMHKQIVVLLFLLSLNLLVYFLFECCLYCCKPILLKYYLAVRISVRCIETNIYVPIEATQILLVLSRSEHAILTASN